MINLYENIFMKIFLIYAYSNSFDPKILIWMKIQVHIKQHIINNF